MCFIEIHKDLWYGMGIVAQLCAKTRETNEKDGEEEG